MTALAIIGLVVGLVVFVVVVKLLHGTLAPLRAVLADVQSAKTAPMLEHGVKGVDQLSRTRQLAGSVPDLALRYLNKLGASGPAPSYTPAPPTQTYSQPAPAPAYQGAPAADERVPEPPAWKNYS